MVPQVKGDPWCLGYFVDNELSWGGFGDEGGRYGLALGALEPRRGRARPPSVPSSSGSRRSTATSPGSTPPGARRWRDWQALEAPWKPSRRRSAWTEGFKADLAGFVKELARTYFKTVRDQLKAADPDHLYLGCRFAWRTEEAVAAAAEFCDVVSFNIYDRRVDPGEVGLPDDAGPARDHRRVPRRRPRPRHVPHRAGLGLQPGGTRRRSTPTTSRSVLDNPALVGCHWFQYVDEPLTGRSFDGENYNIGFLTVTDTPYPELVAAARAIHAQAYARRSGRRDQPTERAGERKAVQKSVQQIREQFAVTVHDFEGTVRYALRRCSAGVAAAGDRFIAVLTSPTCENACGKLPTSRPACGSYSSASRPTSLRSASSRSKIRRRLVVPAHAGRRLSASQKVQAQERPLARRQAVDRRLGRRSGARSRRAAGRCSIAATVPRTRGSSAGRKPTSGIISRLASSSLRAVGLDERAQLRRRTPRGRPRAWISSRSAPPALDRAVAGRTARPP